MGTLLFPLVSGALGSSLPLLPFPSLSVFGIGNCLCWARGWWGLMARRLSGWHGGVCIALVSPLCGGVGEGERLHTPSSSWTQSMLLSLLPSGVPGELSWGRGAVPGAGALLVAGVGH